MGGDLIYDLGVLQIAGNSQPIDTSRVKREAAVSEVDT